MPTFRVRSSRKQAFHVSRFFASLFILLFIIHEIVVFYLLTMRDRRIQDLERAIRDREKEYQGLSLRYGKIKQENQQLRERQRILDIIEEFNPGLTDQEKTSLGSVIWEESNRYGYDPIVLMALILTESSFRPQVSSHKGAKGLMQILPSLGEQLSEEVGRAHGIETLSAEDLLDPEVNVKVGSYYLMKLILRFGNVKNAIKAYNEGPSDIQRRLRRGKPMPQVYYEKIRKNYRLLKAFADERDAEYERQQSATIALNERPPVAGEPSNGLASSTDSSIQLSVPDANND